MDNLEIYSATDIGGRSNNEDKVLTINLNDLAILAVADGMGGHSAGEVASGVAMIEIEKYFQMHPHTENLKLAAVESINKANKEIYQLSQENFEYTGMGTTLVMAIIKQTNVIIANVGDSRAYLITGNEIRKITKDHSAVQELLERGTITEEEARQHPFKGTLTRALGMEQEVKLDLYETMIPGDILMLCSDGLTDSLSDEEMNEVIRSASNMDKACSNLIRRAKEKDVRDNISIILARVKQ